MTDDPTPAAAPRTQTQGAADAAANPAERALLARLDALGVAWRRHAHPPLHTVEQSRALRGVMPGAHTKNLFLKARDGGFWLVSTREDSRFSVNDLGRALGAGRVSFGAAEDMARLLGVRPGAVTPFGLMNDAEGLVRFALDRRLAEAELVNFHPLHNEATLALTPEGLMRFLSDLGRAPLMLDLAPLEARAAAREAAAGQGGDREAD